MISQMIAQPLGEALAQYGVFLAIVVLSARPLGLYLANVFEARWTPLDRVLRPVERAVYRLCRIDPSHDMHWQRYATAFVLFSLVGATVLFAILMLQAFGPWFDPMHQNTPMTLDLAINTALSFATTTTWQAYGGETTMSYFSQAVGLTAQNFLAGAGGLAVGIAFIRGFARAEATGLGNFWVDVTRAILWVLLPFSVIAALWLVWQGVPMNLDRYGVATGLDGHVQTIAQGPVAALESIKNIGTNGGGFFNANGAHPYENPTPLSNFGEMLMIVLLPAALTQTFGRMVRRPREGNMILAVMTLLFAVGLAAGALAEQSGPTRAARPGVAIAADAATADRALVSGNMEGKETRFGVIGSVLTAVTTANGATGSYNAMHDSFTALGGMVPLLAMLLGEIIFGGLGSGLYGMIMMVLIAVFLGGLMVGRTPSFLGKDIKAANMKFVGFYIVASAAPILLLTALAGVCSAGLAGLTTNHGAHGFTEIVYAYTSALANNGQNFAGLSANTPFYNVTTGVAMVIGRFGLAVLALGVAGSVVGQRIRPVSPGQLATDTPLFAAMLIATIVLVGGLSYLPTLALGPIADHVALMR